MFRSFDDDDEDYSDSSENDQKQMEQNDKTAEQFRLDESIRNRGPTITETVMTAVNIEQEWDDFDEVMLCEKCTCFDLLCVIILYISTDYDSG